MKGRRADGFHEIVSVMQEIDLADRLRASPMDHDRIELVCTDPSLPQGSGNLVVKAAQQLRQEAGLKTGIRFELEKSIPAGAGLGGGSSDAAAALQLACQIWELPMERPALAAVAAAVGSDVPFFLWGGTCLCEGRGEQVTPLPDAMLFESVLVVPPWRMSTAAAYGALQGRPLGTEDVDVFVAALQSGDHERLAAASFNRFEEVIFGLEPRQADLHRALQATDARLVRLTGSGSAAWCLPAAKGLATQAKRAVACLGVEQVLPVLGCSPGARG